MRRSKSITALVILLLLATLSGCTDSSPVAAKPFRPYYAGKTITIVIPFKEGGGTDLWARFLAPYLEKHIEGNPKVLIKNMAGGEGITGSNWFVANAKPDGTTLLGSSATTMFHSLLGRAEVEYDFAEMKLVAVTATGGVIYSAPGSGVKSVETLKNPAKPLVYGGISATGIDLVALLTYELLGMNVKSVFGFEGKGPSRLAFERGETNLDFQTTPAYQSGVVPLVKEGKALPLMSLGLLTKPGVVERDPVVPDLPTVPEAYRQLTGKAPEGPAYKAYLAYMTAGFNYQKAIWAPNGMPAEAYEALYSAVDRMSKDPEFTAKGAEVLGGYPTFPGREVESTVRDALAVPDEARVYVRTLLNSKYGVKE